jgi:Sec-independent protein translocase protein TatA
MLIMPLAFIGGTEIFWVLLIGLMLFGGKLPDVAKDMGKMFFKARRSLEEIRRESGIDGAIRDLEKESRDLNRAAQDLKTDLNQAHPEPDWRQSIDHSAGPGAEVEVAEVESEDDSQQSCGKPDDEE